MSPSRLHVWCHEDRTLSVYIGDSRVHVRVRVYVCMDMRIISVLQLSVSAVSIARSLTCVRLFIVHVGIWYAQFQHTVIEVFVSF